METRANYALIGAFTLIGLIAAFGFMLWLTKLDVERQYSYFDVLFEDVSGLSLAGGVRYNGLPVGQVVDLKLDEEDPSKVRVRLEVDARTPVTNETVATLQSQGITGVGYVALAGGGPDATPLPRGGTIPSERSGLASLIEGAPELLEKAIDLLDEVREVVNEENRSAVSDTLQNIASASARLDKTLSDFESLSSDLGSAAREIAGFTDRLGSLSDTAEITLSEATETLKSVRGSVDTAGEAFATADTLMQGELKEFIERGADAARTLDTVVSTLEPSVISAMQSAQALIEERLPALVAQVQDTAKTLEDQVSAVGIDASSLMTRYEEVGAQVQARVAQTETAIAAFETATVEATAMLDSVRQTSDAAGTVITEDIKPLADEATQTLAAAKSLAQDRLPAVIDQTQSTLATVENEAKALSSGGQQMLAEATERLTEAKTTLAAFDEALRETDGMMESMTATSNTIGTLVQGDGAALVADARVAAEAARDAMETINLTVQRDVPGLMEDVRAAAATASDVIDSVGTEIARAGGNFETLSAESSVALASATEAFTLANDTLTSITRAMDTADGTLVAAEQTFTSVNQVIDEDIDVIVADIRTAVGAFTTTVTGVSSDFDQVADEVLAASQSASSLAGTLDGIVQDNRRQVSDLLRVGIPQLIRFFEESRVLVNNLDRLANRVERDPARFLLGTQNSEFRR
ncbi:MlaD family protein [Shimia abyssi]|uniref:ABC-type transporter Mla subunit MlaD n=1 Tax=Shimia abyssi TaxID=1662395 RepID=A0A2P8FEF5_9RHOB|nr:MlaD family protein [Shimia abyssi]PSL20106.1 ABC-type transporter Mla subunit MlaD [Shimia abyssi]